ncbi:MAG: hypothetical protein WA484_09165, partial [Solirubrobacteraceae bacterium]
MYYVGGWTALAFAVAIQSMGRVRVETAPGIDRLCCFGPASLRPLSCPVWERELPKELADAAER